MQEKGLVTQKCETKARWKKEGTSKVDKTQECMTKNRKTKSYPTKSRRTQVCRTKARPLTIIGF